MRESLNVIDLTFALHLDMGLLSLLTDDLKLNWS